MKSLGFADLRGKVAVLTGGTGVIGQALARALAEAGVKVALAGRDRAKADALAANLAAETGGAVLGLAFDVLDQSGLEAARAEVNRTWGPVDLLINAAGGNRPTATTAVEQLTPEGRASLAGSFFGLNASAFSEVLQLNLVGTLLPTQVFAQDMVDRGGVVLNVSSMSAARALTKVPAYSASKAGLNNLTQWLAVHLAPVGIRVNAVAPGFFLTEQNRFLMLDESGAPTPRQRKIVAATPMARLGQVDELRGAVLFLLSDLSRFVTGVVLPVDGGFSAYGGV